MAFSSAVFLCALFCAGTLVSGDKILFVLTNVDTMSNGHPTGWYLPELAHPYKILMEAGYEFDAVSPNGGLAPVDSDSVSRSQDDAVSQWFLTDSVTQDLVQNTLSPDQVNAEDYVAVFYPGGHGPMYDLAKDEATAAIATELYKNGGVVAAICHGPAGLIPVKAPNGEPIVKGRNVTSFTNAEETYVGLTTVMPFLLETKLSSQGANFLQASPGQPLVVRDGKLLTGQNPPSSVAMANKLVEMLKE